MSDGHRLSIFLKTRDDADLDELLTHLAHHDDVKSVTCGHDTYTDEQE